MAKTLTRSPTDKFLGGVCGGIAEYLGAPSWLIRIIAVILLFVPIPVLLVILIYILMWAFVPLGTAKKPLDKNTIDAEYEVKE